MDQLPPVNHPARQSVTNGNNPLDQSTNSVQNQFESLSLNSPLQPIVTTEQSSQQFGTVQINNEFNNTEETIEDNPNENEQTGDLSLTNEDSTRGSYFELMKKISFFLNLKFNRISEYSTSKYVDKKRN